MLPLSQVAFASPSIISSSTAQANWQFAPFLIVPPGETVFPSQTAVKSSSYLWNLQSWATTQELSSQSLKKNSYRKTPITKEMFSFFDSLLQWTVRVNVCWSSTYVDWFIRRMGALCSHLRIRHIKLRHEERRKLTTDVELSKED